MTVPLVMSILSLSFKISYIAALWFTKRDDYLLTTSKVG